MANSAEQSASNNGESPKIETYYTSPEKLKEIYKEGWQAGAQGLSARKNPYFAEKNRSKPYPLGYSVQWELGREDEINQNPKQSNLSPDLLAGLKKRLH